MKAKKMKKQNLSLKVAAKAGKKNKRNNKKLNGKKTQDDADRILSKKNPDQDSVLESDEDENFTESLNSNNHETSKTHEDGLDVDDYETLEGDVFDDDLDDKDGDFDQGSSLALVEAIQEIAATKRRPKKRKEPGKNVEEFVAIKRRVNVGDGGVNKFLESIKETGEDKAADKIAKLVSETEKSKNTKKKIVKTLDVPAERIVADKTKRTILYENTKEELNKWNSVVYHNRAAEQLVFPLSKDNKGFKKTKKDNKGFLPVTPLEEEIAKVLYGEDYVEKKKAEMAKDPEKTDMESYLLSVEEAMATHSEMAKLRALQSYAMAKAKRQRKIKSKKYHRLLRKSKIKEQIKEFEELQKKDPEAALAKLEELERARVEERMSLKHRNTSKWAKMHSARAKYDKDSRNALQEQLKISRDLTQKVQESSDEDEEDMELPRLVKSSVENPWMLKPSFEENEKLQMYYTGYKKFWDEYNRQMQKHAQEEESSDDDQDSGSKNMSNKTEKKGKAADGDADEIREIVTDNEPIITEDYSLDDADTSTTMKGTCTTVDADENSGSESVVKNQSLEVNPANFLRIKKAGSSIAPQFNAENSNTIDFLEESDESNDETEQRQLIAEAFEDDDVVSAFVKQKKEDMDASQPQDIDNYLPGWGSWTGKNITPDVRKRQRFVKKAKKRPPRKDARVSHVIINESVDDKVRPHQVKQVPFPFTRVKDFEKTIRAPIGRTWMPEHAVKSLTAPKVITRLGSTIKPISEDALAKKPKEKKFHVPNSIIRMAKVTNK